MYYDDVVDFEHYQYDYDGYECECDFNKRERKTLKITEVPKHLHELISKTNKQLMCVRNFQETQWNEF